MAIVDLAVYGKKVDKFVGGFVI